MSSEQLYDTIGAPCTVTRHTVTRHTEPRIAARIWAALGDARTVLNVGAGTGPHQPAGRRALAFPFDTSDPGQCWLTRDHLPEFAGLQMRHGPAAPDALAGAIGARTEPVLVPWDCADGFFEAGCRRPEVLVA